MRAGGGLVVDAALARRAGDRAAYEAFAASWTGAMPLEWHVVALLEAAAVPADR